MKPVVLLIGRLPGVIGSIAKELEEMPIRWLGAHHSAEVIRQLETEPEIACVVIGGGLDDAIRGELIGVIAAQRPDISIHLKDRASGPEGMAPFVRTVVDAIVLRRGAGVKGAR